MIRLEYTVDSLAWIHIAEDFNSLADVQKYIRTEGLADFAKQIKILHITKEEIFRVNPDDNTMSTIERKYHS